MSVRGFTRGVENAGEPRVLVVILHGWLKGPARMKDVLQATRETLEPENRVDTFIPTLPYSRLFGKKRAVDVVHKVIHDIDKIVAEEPGYERIVIVGYSLGATIARRVFLVAAGNPYGFRTEEKFLGEERREWVTKIDRIVLLAAFNRGWQITPRLSWLYSLVLNVSGLLGHLAPKWASTIFDIRLGAPFMVQTRLHWLAYRRRQLSSGLANVTATRQLAGQASPSPEPILIQLIGSEDDLISPFDQVDIAVDGGSSVDRSYFLIKLDRTDHKSAVCFTGKGSEAEIAKVRKNLFKIALNGSTQAVADEATHPNLLIDQIETPEEEIEQTVFVIHGIRDDGFWTHRVAEKVREVANAPKTFRAWTPTYGYFAMLPFLLPWIRRLKAEWFMDQYVSAVAQYPNSIFHYVGHSNGTYLAARGLADYPACVFGNVFFAGSVVRSDYDWKTFVKQGRVARVLNVVASTDWVVALAPKALQWIPRSDIGGAGFDGFHQADGSPAAETNPGIKIVQRKFVQGGHGAGIAETQWANIANFIVRNEVPSSGSAGFVDEQPLWLKFFSATRSVLWLAGGIAGLCVPALIVWSRLDKHLCDPVLATRLCSAAFTSTLSHEGAVLTAVLFVYYLLLKFVITRF